MEQQTVQEIDPKKHIEFAVMNGHGDTKLIWSRDNPDEVENARRSFGDLKSKGYAVFLARGKNGDKDEQVDEFDPASERYIFVPPMRGG
jgi:hypothetical protein